MDLEISFLMKALLFGLKMCFFIVACLLRTLLRISENASIPLSSKIFLYL